MNPSPSTACPRCGAILSADAPRGLCPACLLGAHFGPGVVPTEAGPGEASAPPLSPQEIAPLFPELEIISCLGRGGMGVVYKARQPKLDRLVALKILPPGISHDSAFSTRFAHEAKALARLNHPGIVTLYEFGQVPGGQYFFLMEFIDGVNLRQLQQTGRVSAREALAIVPQICDALQYAHDHGIIHRDIKPENLLIDRRGRVKIADFGLAKLVGSTGEPRADSDAATGASPEQTEAGRVMGTPSYMAPEQHARPAEVDHRADIYALGVVFYQLLTGELPGRQLEPPSRKVSIDVRLDEVVLRALEKEPGLRYQQVGEVKTRLETIASTESGAERISSVASERPAPTEPRRWSWRTTAGVAASLVIGTVAIVWASQRAEPSVLPRVETKEVPVAVLPKEAERAAPGVIEATSVIAAAAEEEQAPREGSGLFSINLSAHFSSTSSSEETEASAPAVVAAAIEAPVVAGPPIVAPKERPSREVGTALVLDLAPYFRNAYAPQAGPNVRFRSLYGRQVIDGVPMQIDGEIILFSQVMRAKSKNVKAVESALIQGIAVGRAFDELHLVHHTRQADVEGRPVAIFTIHYEDGSAAAIPVVYGGHLREWLRHPAEEKELLTDPSSKVFWRGAGAESIDATGRLFKSTLLNPHPEKKVRTLDLSSVTNGLAAYTLLAATVAQRDSARAVTPPVPLGESERNFTGRVTVRVIDERNEKPLIGALIAPTVFADNKYYGLPPLLTDANGEALLRFPLELTTHLVVNGSKAGWSDGEESCGPEASRLTMRLKRAKEAPVAETPAAPITAPEPQPARAQETTLALDLAPFYRIVFAKQSGKGERFKAVHGRQLLDGVPLYLDGEVVLFGQTESEWSGAQAGLYAKAVQGVRIDRTFDALHLVHHTRWPDVEGRTVATITLHYEDGAVSSLPIVYGGHLRDWLRLRSEEKETLTAPGSKIFWRGAGVTKLHAKGRLFKSTFSNPHPDKKVLTMDVSSAENLAAYSLLAATVAQRDPSRKLTPPVPDVERTFDGAVALVVVDAATALPVPGVLIEQGVTLGNLNLTGTPLLTGEDGQTTLRYPAEEAEQISIQARKNGWQSATATYKPGDPKLVIRLEPKAVVAP